MIPQPEDLATHINNCLHSYYLNSSIIDQLIHKNFVYYYTPRTQTPTAERTIQSSFQDAFDEAERLHYLEQSALERFNTLQIHDDETRQRSNDDGGISDTQHVFTDASNRNTNNCKTDTTNGRPPPQDRNDRRISRWIDRRQRQLQRDTTPQNRPDPRTK